MAAKGVLPTAIDDAVALAMQGKKVELADDVVKLNDKTAEEAVNEFLAARPHLLKVAGKVEEKKIVGGGKPAPTNDDYKKFLKTLSR
jgi:hypothetical protein